LACDIRIASEDAKFGLTEVRRGILPGAGGTQRLSRVIGVAKAVELCLSGDLIDASAASRLGLVNDVVPVTELLPRAKALALSFLKGAPISSRYIKEAIYKGWDLPLEEGLRLEADLAAMISTTEDSHEGPRAFVEKRQPVWRGGSGFEQRPLYPVMLGERCCRADWLRRETSEGRIGTRCERQFFPAPSEEDWNEK
jgi:enoyl-CoA hydratase/carnithine racemase